ncbi:MAG TPA: HNH endonuclease [Anaerolineales bacterium]|nr:HNH endonuclease [Anaerolineales bacterium]
MAIVYQNGIAGKICVNPKCGWKPVSEFHPRRSLDKPVGDGYKSRCKDCWNAQKRAERAANPEKHRETARKYVEANKEHIRNLKRKHQAENPEKYDKALRKYRKAHREEINIKAKERRERNLEHYREIGRNSYERHAEERRKYSIEYYKRYPEKSVAATNRRRALKYASEITHTEEEWQELKAFYNFTCLRCGKQEAEIKLTRDHVVPLTQGGSDSIDNVQPLCARCNSKKNNKHIDYR